MPFATQLFTIILFLSSATVVQAQMTNPAGSPDLSGLSCDSDTVVRLQHFVMSTETSKPTEAKRTFELKPIGNNEYKLVLHFSKNDPAIRKAVQDQINNFQSRCNIDLINRKLGATPYTPPENNRSLADALPALKVEVPEVKRSGRLSLDINPTGAPGGSGNSDKLSTEIVINKSEYEKILEQSSLPLNGMGVRLTFSR